MRARDLCRLEVFDMLVYTKSVMFTGNHISNSTCMMQNLFPPARSFHKMSPLAWSGNFI